MLCAPWPGYCCAEDEKRTHSPVSKLAARQVELERQRSMQSVSMRVPGRESRMSSGAVNTSTNQRWGPRHAPANERSPCRWRAPRGRCRQAGGRAGPAAARGAAAGSRLGRDVIKIQPISTSASKQGYLKIREDFTITEKAPTRPSPGWKRLLALSHLRHY